MENKQFGRWNVVMNTTDEGYEFVASDILTEGMLQSKSTISFEKYDELETENKDEQLMAETANIAETNLQKELAMLIVDKLNGASKIILDGQSDN